MTLDALKETPHRRFNPLTGDWVLVSPHRTQRPWQGQVEKLPPEATVAYDPGCYLCPGNQRAGGVRNPAYTSTFVFDNDFAALKPLSTALGIDEGDCGLIVADSESGICRVICFSPVHDLTLARMKVADIKSVVDVWAEQSRELGAMDNIRYVQIFENRGATMGCSNPHPHCQIWANQTVPNEPAKELRTQLDYRAQHGSCMLCDYLALEQKSGERIVCANDWFTALVPFWAVWPFELILLSNHHLGSMDQMNHEQRFALADILKRITTRYDNVFETSFPYSMGFHQQPTDGQRHDEWHFHAHFYPPLLRSATVRKFMVGYEMLAAPQRDITPEAAAGRLRDVGEIHYLDK
ncbi:MAG TPA: UDP-glucose--hexose-1-phosphate uridylyltransferase [Terriglobales bacterium]|nr:UDP-glucose--hexose-1-phosphate uridylyltransferase [Terriglobales bacterium]